MKYFFKYVFPFLNILLFITDRASAQWLPINNLQDELIYTVYAKDTQMFAGALGGIYRSTDYGMHWELSNNGITNNVINAFISKDTNLFVGTGGGLFRSTNNGNTWSSVLTLPKYVTSFSMNDSIIFAGTWTEGVYRSSNNGSTWDQINSGLWNSNIFENTVNAFFIYQHIIFVGTQGGIFYSSNNGAQWIRLNLEFPDVKITALAEFKGQLYAGSENYGLFHIVKNDTNWLLIKMDGGIQNINFLLSTESQLYLAGYENGNYEISASNDVVNWKTFTNELKGYSIYSLAICGANIFSAGDGLWHLPLSGINAVQSYNRQNISEYFLCQNYPNPFNPTTRINFSLPTSSYATLKIYDPIGREIHTLLSANLEAGDHSIVWDAAKYPSSVYYYRLQTGSMSITRKLLLLK